MSSPQTGRASALELTSANLDESQRDAQEECPQNGINDQGLLPADRGSAAWRLLLASFVFEALLWGHASRYSKASKCIR